MRKHIILLSLFLIVFLAGCATNGNNRDTSSILQSPEKALSDAFMAKVAEDDIPGAFEIVKSKFPISSDEIDALISKTIQQRKTLVSSRYKGTVGTEFIGYETAGDSLLRFTYIEKREIHLLRWQFIFYKPKDEWIVNDVLWDDEVKQVFGLYR